MSLLKDKLNDINQNLIRVNNELMRDAISRLRTVLTIIFVFSPKSVCKNQQKDTIQNSYSNIVFNENNHIKQQENTYHPNNIFVSHFTEVYKSNPRRRLFFLRHFNPLLKFHRRIINESSTKSKQNRYERN